jgi:multiple sugar transport system substrate-binding protein
LVEAGIPVAALEEAVWDPEGGGEFGAILARLTLDADGRDALDPEFDAGQVVQHGFATSLGWGPTAVAEWGWLAIAGGTALEENLRADDPHLVGALDWLLAQVQRGIAATPGEAAAERIAALRAGVIAVTPVGSWDLAAVADAPVSLGFARLPLGPAGRGGAVVALGFDAISAGTAYPDEAWAWVLHLASPSCRGHVADAGEVLPTSRDAARSAGATWAEGGLDVNAFLAPSLGWDHPIAGWPRGVDAIMGEVIDAIAAGLASPATLLAHAREAIDRLTAPP